LVTAPLAPLLLDKEPLLPPAATTFCEGTAGADDEHAISATGQMGRKSLSIMVFLCESLGLAGAATDARFQRHQ
jgi:hypothetical protein